MEDKVPKVWMLNMNSSSLDFNLIIWIKGDNTQKGLGITSTYLIEIYNALNKSGIVIPFPQLDLHIKEMPNKGI